jgi:hypothetical protein
LMRSYKHYIHRYKIPFNLSLLLLGILLLVLGLWSYPYNNPIEGAPLESLKGINFLVVLFGFVLMLVGAYYIYDYASSKRKFEALMDTNSETLFRRNQIELERLALKLSVKEEQRVMATLKKYRIR